MWVRWLAFANLVGMPALPVPCRMLSIPHMQHFGARDTKFQILKVVKKSVPEKLGKFEEIPCEILRIFAVGIQNAVQLQLQHCIMLDSGFQYF